jgi:hypothetical protein
VLGIDFKLKNKMLCDPSTRHKGAWRTGGIGLRVLNFTPRCGRVISSTPAQGDGCNLERVYAKKKKIVFLLPGTEPRALGRPAHSVPIELPLQ